MYRTWTLVLWSLVGLTLATKTLTIDGGDVSRINYTTFDTSDNTNATWSKTAANLPNNCNSEQHTTERVGDYATFIFNGTGVSLIGTIGVRRGLINFTLDGQETGFDRTANPLKCDVAIFSRTGLPDQQHVLVAKLVGKEYRNSDVGFDGILSIQRIQYTVPSSNTSAIIGGTVGGIALLVIIAGGIWFYRRKRRDGSSGAFFDNSDVPPHQNAETSPIPGMVATPFEWNASQAPNDRTSREMGQYSDRPQTLFSHGSHYAESLPGSPTPFLPQGSTSGPSSGDRRESKASYVTSNPDRRSSTSFANPSVGGDEVLVDRIAMRLADIMQGRAGPGMDLPPPVYEPGNASASNPNAQTSAAPAPPAGDTKAPPAGFMMSNVVDTPPTSADSQTMPSPWRGVQAQLASGGETLTNPHQPTNSSQGAPHNSPSPPAPHDLLHPTRTSNDIASSPPRTSSDLPPSNPRRPSGPRGPR